MASVADDTKSIRLFLSQIIPDSMKELGRSYPTVEKERLKELKANRKEPWAE